jgi:hypothetical protein
MIELRLFAFISLYFHYVIFHIILQTVSYHFQSLSSNTYFISLSYLSLHPLILFAILNYFLAIICMVDAFIHY